MSLDKNDTYQKLHKLSKHIQTLKGIESLLDWDQETFMPPKSAQHRSDQLQVLAGIIHREKMSPEFHDTLTSLICLKSGDIFAKDLSDDKQLALKEWRREYLRDTSLPADFVEEFAKTTSESMHVWQKAKSDNDFKSFLPHLEKVIALCRKKADFIGYNDHPYDALLDGFEPYLTKKHLEKTFTPLKSSITALLKKIKSAEQVDDSFLSADYEIDRQKRFGDKLLDIIGYDKQSGRLDFSSHPFSSCAHPSDSRITTRVIANNPMSNIRSILHECGHAFYDTNLPVQEFGSPLGEAISLGIHESQSRFWETRIGMSRSFWHYTLPILKQYFPKQLQGVDLNTFYRAINKVEPSFIRTDADEVTYPLHVILRFEIEVMLIEGSLKAKDLPDMWREKMKELLGVCPENDTLGCLQDVHWSMGAIGYFPTYALGTLFTSHFFEGFEKQNPDWDKRVENGEFAFIKEWLHQNIHKWGKRYNSLELLEKVAQKPFTAGAFESYLTQKYQAVYGFSSNL